MRVKVVLNKDCSTFLCKNGPEQVLMVWYMMADMYHCS
jgi:hypothetical protein